MIYKRITSDFLLFFLSNNDKILQLKLFFKRGIQYVWTFKIREH